MSYIPFSCIVWNNDADLRTYKEKFDFVLCADCLYFRDCHLALLRCMSLILKDKVVFHTKLVSLSLKHGCL
jgi:hypothetical protein